MKPGERINRYFPSTGNDGKRHVVKTRRLIRSMMSWCFLLSLVISPLFHLIAEDYIPPSGVSWEKISISTKSNAVSKTLASGYGYWFRATIARGKPCTIWTSNITKGTITGITVYEIGTSQTGSATASSRFTASTDRDGNLRLKLLATAWSSSDDLSYIFYFNVTGSANTKFTLNFQLKEVDEVLVGSRNRPYLFDFWTSSAPKTQYGMVSNSILDAGPDVGSFYAVSDLTAGKRYYFGISTNTESTTQLTVSDPDGQVIDLSALRNFTLWNSIETNVHEQVTLFTNVEEHIVIQTRSTMISDVSYSATNETVVTGVITNETGGVTVVQTNFVSIVNVVTNEDIGTVSQQMLVEVSTNYEYFISSIYTNRVYETNVNHVGICRDAWKFVPTKSGRYVFRFDGQDGSSFTMYDAVMSANSYQGEIAFSEADGTFIPDEGFLSVRLSHSPVQSSTNIFYTLDGTDPRFHGVKYEAALKISSSTTVKATALLDDGDYGDVFSACYFLQPGAIAEGLGVSGMDMSLNDTATNWYVDVETTPKGNNAIRHIAIEDGEQVDLAMTLRGRGVFSFRWRTSSENGWDEGAFYTNGVEVARISGETTWDDGFVSIPLVGTNELTWTYSKNEEYCSGSDCLWLAEFEFDQTPDGSRELPYRFEFIETTRLPGATYGTVTKSMTNGCYYLVSSLEANRRYYLGVAIGGDDIELSSVIPPEGGLLPLGNLTEYDPWISGTTNMFDMSGLPDVSFAGICCKAWRFVPQVSGDYIFGFSGEGEFTIHDATMSAIQSGEDIGFSKSDGTVIGQGDYLKVKINCLRELSCTNIYYTTDGTDPRVNGVLYVSALKLEHAAIVKACAAYDDSTFGKVYSARYYDAASQEQVLDALGLVGASASLGGDVAGWYVDGEKSPEGNDAIRNNAIGDEEEVCLTLSLLGKGRFSFNWKASSEQDFDEGVFYTNGVEVARISGEHNWRGEKISIPICGDVELKWKYFKDDEDNFGEDCIWLSDFAFEEFVTLSSGAESVEVARQWFDGYGLADVATAFTQLELSQIDELPAEVVSATNTLPRSLYDSYLCGLNPTNAADVFYATIEMVNDVPVIEWQPNLGEQRRYEILGAPSLDELQWHSPTNSSDRFFKVKVSMPGDAE